LTISDPTPASVNGLRSFFSLYPQVRNFSNKVAAADQPFETPLKNSTVWKWTAQHQTSKCSRRTMKINICPEFGDLLLFTPNSITRECSSPWSRLRPKPEGRTESVAHVRWCQLQTITCWTDKTTYVCYAFISKCCYMHLRQNGYPEKKTPTQTRQADRRSTKQRQPMSWQKDIYQSWQR
ncbi:hypothetical protein T08_2160, partial [Trichinella sp. T8]